MHSMTQQQLAENIGVSRQTINARLFNVKVETVFQLEDTD
jgi:DNA-binding XRE family transcriptional regulator